MAFFTMLLFIGGEAILDWSAIFQKVEVQLISHAAEIQWWGCLMFNEAQFRGEHSFHGKKCLASKNS